MNATQIVHWPGQDTAACDEHAAKLRGLGSLMGISVSSTSCEPQPCANCENEKAKAGEKP